MEVVNNTPQVPPSENSGGGLGFFLGILLLVVFAFVLFYFGLPLLRNTAIPNSQQSQTEEPETNINIPDKIDINIDNKTD